MLHSNQTLKNMKLKTLLALAFLAILFSSYGQDTAQLKRTPYKLTVAVDKKTFYEEDIHATPYILPDNTVQLYPGETVYIEIEQQDGVIKSLRAVKEIADPEKTMIISFTQEAEKKEHKMMMLKVVNPFKQQLVYHASIFLMKQKRWVTTDVYPVEGKLAGIETWPDIITSIGLGQWAFKSK
jgi:hypothetical protein